MRSYNLKKQTKQFHLWLWTPGLNLLTSICCYTDNLTPLSDSSTYRTTLTVTLQVSTTKQQLPSQWFSPKTSIISALGESNNTSYDTPEPPPGTRINRGRRGTAISGIWPSRSRYRENDRDNRDKWNPKKHLQKLYFGISSCVSQSLQSNTIPSQAPLKSRDWSHLLN